MDCTLLSESFRVTATAAAPRAARRRVNAACDGLSAEWTDVAELLVSELVANAVRHPPRDGSVAEGDIIVRIHRTDHVLRVEVEDHDARPLPPVRPPPEPQECGMGLHLVSELASSWGSGRAPTGGGKTVWFEIRTADRDGRGTVIGAS
jgi:anti-sigma regulatory factor (Ser/Thr protein kinase)